MTTKLTLTVEKEIIEKAKSYARKTGRSLSEIIESYLEMLVHENREPRKLSSRLGNLVGSVKLPNNFDEQEELRALLEKKHR